MTTTNGNGGSTRRHAKTKLACAIALLRDPPNGKLPALKTIADWFGVNFTYVYRALELTPEQRLAIVHGFDAETTLASRPVTDEDVFKMIRLRGADHVLELLCRPEAGNGHTAS